MEESSEVSLIVPRLDGKNLVGGSRYQTSGLEIAGQTDRAPVDTDGAVLRGPSADPDDTKSGKGILRWTDLGVMDHEYVPVLGGRDRRNRHHPAQPLLGKEFERGRRPRGAARGKKRASQRDPPGLSAHGYTDDRSTTSGVP